jgi:hypothetical protein
MMSIPANELMRLRQSLEDVSRDLQEKQNEHHLTVLKSGTLQDAIERENAGIPFSPPSKVPSAGEQWPLTMSLASSIQHPAWIVSKTRVAPHTNHTVARDRETRAKGEHGRRIS